MKGLKPCPFCGGEASVTKTRSHEWIIGCDSTYGSACPGYVWKCAPVYFTKELAVKAWNRSATYLPEKQH